MALLEPRHRPHPCRLFRSRSSARSRSSYIAGTRVEDACRVVKEPQRGVLKMATIDVLGEEITTLGGSQSTWATSCQTSSGASNEQRPRLERQRQAHGASGSSSTTASAARCWSALVAAGGPSAANFVRIDMEDASWARRDASISTASCGRLGLDNVGIVLQASCSRTLDDIQALSDLTPDVRALQGDLRRATRRSRTTGSTRSARTSSGRSARSSRAARTSGSRRTMSG